MYLATMALLGFGVLFTLAIRQVRTPANHRVLILFATIPLLPPGINRMYQVLFQLDYLPVLATYLTMAAMAIAIVVHERMKSGAISTAVKIGAAVVLGQQLLHWPVTHSTLFADYSSFVTSLVYYR